MNNDLLTASRLNTQNFLKKISLVFIPFLFLSSTINQCLRITRLAISGYLAPGISPLPGSQRSHDTNGYLYLVSVECVSSVVGSSSYNFTLPIMKLWFWLYSHLPELSLKQQTQMSDLLKSDRWLMFNQFVMQCNASLSELGCHCLFLIGF